MTYKGYTAALEIDEDAGELFGRVLGTRHVITFQGATVEEARRSFEETIDAYLESCRESGEKPDRPFSGKFNVRVPENTHRRLAEIADARRISLNDAVSLALLKYVREHGVTPSEAQAATTSRPKRKAVVTPFIGSVYLTDGTLMASDVDGDIRKGGGPNSGYMGEFTIDVAHNSTLLNGEKFILKTDAKLSIEFRVRHIRANSLSSEVAVDFVSEGKPLEGG